MTILRCSRNDTGHMPSNRRVATVFLAGMSFALGSASVIPAQRPRPAVVSADSARLVADLFFRAVADEKWDAAARFVDTIPVKRKVALSVRSARSAMPSFMAIEEIMQLDPKMPREVAEYQLKQARDRATNFNPAEFITYEFADVNSIRELEGLSALDATARHLQALDSRWALRKSIAASGCGSPDAGPLPAPIHKILAAALGSDSVAYVLHESREFEMPPDSTMDLYWEPMVMRLRLGPQGWRIVPSRTMLSPMNSFIGQVTCDSTQKRKR